MISKQHKNDQSQESTDIRSSSDEIPDFEQELKKMAPNIYKIVSTNKVLKTSQHINFNIGGFDSSQSDEDDEDDDDDLPTHQHTEKCMLLEQEHMIWKNLGKQENTMSFIKLHKDIVIKGKYCCALEMPLYESDFFDKFIQKREGNALTKENYDIIFGSMKQILIQLVKIHELGISHNDLKPENILYSSQRKSPVLIDFEYSKKKPLVPNVLQQKLNWEFRDLTYCSPEVIQINKYKKKYKSNQQQNLHPNIILNSNGTQSIIKNVDPLQNDVYSFTSTFLALLFKVSPQKILFHNTFQPAQPQKQSSNGSNPNSLNCFATQNHHEFEQILKQKGEYNFQKILEFNGFQSQHFIDFFLKGMHYDPLQRYTAQQLAQHPWITGENFEFFDTDFQQQELATLKKYSSVNVYTTEQTNSDELMQKQQ